MKIAIAPDSYKESLTSLEVADAIEAGFRDIFPDADYVKIPVADGGEGTVQAMIAATNGRAMRIPVTGPLGNTVTALYGLSNDASLAIIEMAEASGLALVPPEKRDPLMTTTYGTGELIRAALDEGARHLILGIGGSATNDGGAGMVQALGARLLDRDGKDIGFGGGALHDLAKIDISGLDPRLSACTIDVACDVDNPLTGPLGASAVFGPQKGATPELVEKLDAILTRYAERIRQDLDIDLISVPGTGAAGGLGAAMLAFLKGKLRPGIDIITEAVDLDAVVRDADVVITGEGRIDSQTIHGKTPIGVARIAKRHGKPVIGIAGSLTADVGIVHEHGLDAVFSVLYRIDTLENALANAAANIRMTARNIAATLAMGKNLK